jgi:hypothetical protein
MSTHFLLRDGESTGPQRVDRYPNPPICNHTVNALTHGWSGNIRILGSIELQPTSDSWFELINVDVRGKVGTPMNHMWNHEGCFIWLKAEITTLNSSGRVDRITTI